MFLYYHCFLVQAKTDNTANPVQEQSSINSAGECIKMVDVHIR